MDNNVVVVFMTAITIYALFFDDIRIIFFMKPSDDIFFGISTAALFFFTLELVLASLAKPKEYFLHFFFWLDLVSTLSLIPDIGWIWDNITNVQSADNATSLAKTSRAGRVTRVIRVIRLIRLIRIVKLYKQAKMAAQRRREAKEREELKRRQQLVEEEPLSNMTRRPTMRRVLPLTPPSLSIIKEDSAKEGISREQDDNLVFPSTRDAITKEDPPSESPMKLLQLEHTTQPREETKADRPPIDDHSPMRRRVTKMHTVVNDSFREQRSRDGGLEDAPLESKISRTLSDKTIKTVILLILAMLFLMPLF